MCVTCVYVRRISIHCVYVRHINIHCNKHTNETMWDVYLWHDSVIRVSISMREYHSRITLIRHWSLVTCLVYGSWPCTHDLTTSSHHFISRHHLTTSSQHFMCSLVFWISNSRPNGMWYYLHTHTHTHWHTHVSPRSQTPARMEHDIACTHTHTHIHTHTHKSTHSLDLSLSRPNE